MRSSARPLHPGILALVLAVAMGACDPSSDVTLLGIPTTVPVSFDAEALVGAEFPTLERTVDNQSGHVVADPFFAADRGRMSGIGIGYGNGIWMAIGGLSLAGGAQLWWSVDGAVWRPRYDGNLGEASPLGVLAIDSGGWVLVTEPFSGAAANLRRDVSLGFWHSSDGLTWIEATGPSVPATFKEYGHAVSGSNSAVLLREEGGIFGEAPSPPTVVYTIDSGAKWNQVSLGGEPESVLAVGDDLIVWGSFSGSPALWRLSTGWKPEQISGLGVVKTVLAVAQTPVGRFVLMAGSPGLVETTWFESTDLKTWTETTPLTDFPFGAELFRRGPFLLAGVGANAKVSVDGTTWTELVVGSPGQDWWMNPKAGFASDGSMLIVVFGPRLLSDHSMTFTWPEYPGAWDEVTRLPRFVVLVGAGADQYLVHQGKVQIIEDGTLVALPDPPMVLPDSTGLQVTETAVFAIAEDRAWVFRNGEWKPSNLPLAGSPTQVAEQGDGFIVMTVAEKEVQKFVSKDGAHWSPAPMETVAADWLRQSIRGFVAESVLPGEASYVEIMAASVMLTVDGSEWVSMSRSEAMTEIVVGDGQVTALYADGEVTFPLPEGARFRNLVALSRRTILVNVVKDEAPYLLVITAEGDQIWAARQLDDPLISQAWYDGTRLYALGTLSEGSTIYVWNPDAE